MVLDDQHSDSEERYIRDKNIALLEPDVLQAFPTDEAVNQALRLMMRIAEIPRRKEPA